MRKHVSNRGQMAWVDPALLVFVIAVDDAGRLRKFVERNSRPTVMGAVQFDMQLAKRRGAAQRSFVNNRPRHVVNVVTKSSEVFGEFPNGL